MFPYNVSKKSSKFEQNRIQERPPTDQNENSCNFLSKNGQKMGQNGPKLSKMVKNWPKMAILGGIFSEMCIFGLIICICAHDAVGELCSLTFLQTNLYVVYSRGPGLFRGKLGDIFACSPIFAYFTRGDPSEIYRF